MWLFPHLYSEGNTPALLALWGIWRSNETVFGNDKITMQMTSIITPTAEHQILSVFQNLSLNSVFNLHAVDFTPHPCRKILWGASYLGLELLYVCSCRIHLKVIWDKEKTGIGGGGNRSREMVAQRHKESWCSFIPRWHWHLSPKPKVLIQS